MFTFCGVTEDAEQVARRIRRVLGRRHAMHIGELHMRLGMDRTSVQAALEAMMARGEVERLRPIDCSREDHDFFRVNRPVTMSVKATDRWTTHIAQTGPESLSAGGRRHGPPHRLTQI